MDIRGVRQSEAVDAFISHTADGGVGALIMATGAGKTKTAIDYLKTLNKRKKTRVLVITPTTNLIDNWKDEINRWDKTLLTGKRLTIEFMCSASMHKRENEHYDVVIHDECHTITNLQDSFYRFNNCVRVMGLTGTLPPPAEALNGNLTFWSRFGNDICYTYDLETAVEDGVVMSYKVTVIKMRLNSRNKDYEVGPRNNRYKVTAAQKYKYLTKAIQRIMFSGKEVPAFLFINRMRFLATTKQKEKVVKDLLKNKKDKTLVFCNNIKQAESLVAKAYHSKSEEDTLAQFKKGYFTQLGVIGKVDMGENIPQLTRAIIVQIDSNTNKLMQRLGRIIRKDTEQEPELIILCHEGTKDEDWLSKALANIPKDKIQVKWQ